MSEEEIKSDSERDIGKVTFSDPVVNDTNKSLDALAEKPKEPKEVTKKPVDLEHPAWFKIGGLLLNSAMLVSCDKSRSSRLSPQYTSPGP